MSKTTNRFSPEVRARGSMRFGGAVSNCGKPAIGRL